MVPMFLNSAYQVKCYGYKIKYHIAVHRSPSDQILIEYDCSCNIMVSLSQFLQDSEAHELKLKQCTQTSHSSFHTGTKAFPKPFYDCWSFFSQHLLSPTFKGFVRLAYIGIVHVQLVPFYKQLRRPLAGNLIRLFLQTK